MNKKQVGISVVIPTKNEEKYLSRLLDSINRQTYTNFEVLVCDFKSSDKTREIAKEKGAGIITLITDSPYFWHGVYSLGFKIVLQVRFQINIPG